MNATALDRSPSRSRLLDVVLALGALTMTIALGMFAYLGTFTRFRADDYCEMVLINSGPLWSDLAIRYQTASDRFSNFLFVALSQWLSPHSVAFIPAVMILLWAAGLTWLVYASRQLLGLRWPVLIDLFLAAALAFFAIFQAPDLFQTIYWRSAMATHFAPLVYLTAFAALLLTQVRRADSRPVPAWLGPLFLVIAFFGGGFSEPPDAVLIVLSGFALTATLLLAHGPRRQAAWKLLAWTLVGGLITLVVMRLAPGNYLRLGTPPPGLVTLVSRSIIFTGQFILDSLLTLPTPTLISILMPFCLAYGFFAASKSPSDRRLLIILMVGIPILTYILIMASFAPSVYGQSYPEARARFLGRLLMTAALMLEGGCLGLLAAGWKLRWSQAAASLSLILLAVLAFYPLRGAWNVVQDKLPVYKSWAASWDKRQNIILADRARGVQNLTIFQLRSIDFVKDLDPDPKNWVNQCAAQYYGFQSISAP